VGRQIRPRPFGGRRRSDPIRSVKCQGFEAFSQSESSLQIRPSGRTTGNRQLWPTVIGKCPIHLP
jgi:hypothetical protein